MSDYVYRNPLDQGYKQFTLTKKQHNELFKYRQIKWHDKYEYYYNEHYVLLHKFLNWKAILFLTITFPINLLIVGLGNTKEAIHDMKKLYNQKKYGSFSVDDCSSKGEIYKKIMDIIKENEI